MFKAWHKDKDIKNNYVCYGFDPYSFGFFIKYGKYEWSIQLFWFFVEVERSSNLLDYVFDVINSKEMK